MLIYFFRIGNIPTHIESMKLKEKRLESFDGNDYDLHEVSLKCFLIFVIGKGN